MNLNKISAEVPQETEAQVVKHIKDALTQLPFLIQLSKLERIRMAKFSRKNLAFVERGLMYAQANPSFVPGPGFSRVPVKRAIGSKIFFWIEEKMAGA